MRRKGGKGGRKGRKEAQGDERERRKTKRREDGRSLFFYGMWDMSPYLLKSDYSPGNDHKGLYLNMLLNLVYLLH